MPTRKTSPKLVLVVWQDAHCAWDCVEHAPLETWSVGWLVKKDRAGVTIAMDSYPTDPEEHHTTAFIPAGMIASIQTVGHTKE